MKKLLLAFAFLPMLSFAQENKLNGIVSGINEKDKKVIICKKCGTDKKIYFVDEKKVENNVLSTLNPLSIKSIEVIKTDPEYPEGKVLIVLNK
ncbi:hypothetical protein ACTS9V_15135 [Empedobacter falsenii]